MLSLHAGRQVKLQQGSLAVLQRAQTAGVPTHIISVNWSSELVRAALQQPPLSTNAGISGKAAASLASQGATCTDACKQIWYLTDMKQKNWVTRTCVGFYTAK